MRLTKILTLVIIGGVTFAGLGILLKGAFPNIFVSTGDGYTYTSLMAVSVAVALFLLGIFLGYVYYESHPEKKPKKRTVARFKKALKFERDQRAITEQELFEAKKIASALRDRLSKCENTEQGIEPGQSVELTNKIVELTARSEQLRKDLNQRKQRIADLLTELSIAQAEVENERLKAEGAKASASPVSPFMSIKGATLTQILETIASFDGVKVALVADDYGLVVASAGTGLPPEPLAAASSMAADFGPKIAGLLPVDEMAMLSIGGSDGLVWETHFFVLYGIKCALIVARDENKPLIGLCKQAVLAIVEQFR